jgi:hypothetical protein
MPTASIYTTWLPQTVAQEALEQEPKRFAAGVAALVSAVAAARAVEASPGCWGALLSQVLDDVKR